MNSETTDWSRATGHNPDAFWNSTGLRIWNHVMKPEFLFDNIGYTDLHADLSLQLMSQFVERCCKSPPVKPSGDAYAVDTLVKTLEKSMQLLSRKYHD